MSVGHAQAARPANLPVWLLKDDARPYFESQPGFTSLPDWMFYRAMGGVCLAFHPDHHPGVWMVHVGALREALGRTTEPARALLEAFWAEQQPAHVIGWIETRNRAACALARRVGMRREGQMACGVEMFGWRPEWV